MEVYVGYSEIYYYYYYYYYYFFNSSLKQGEEKNWKAEKEWNR